MCHAHPTRDVTIQDEVLGELVANLKAFRGFARRRLRDDVVADEVLHDALAKSLGKLGTIREPGAAVAWFWRVLRNAVNDRFRALEAERGRACDVETDAVAAVVDEPEGRACGCVHGAIDALKPEYAAILREVELGGKAVKAWAQENGVTANNAGVRVFRARRALAEQVRHTCGTCAEGHCRDCCCG